jgi:hypothetical protein
MLPEGTSKLIKLEPEASTGASSDRKVKFNPDTPLKESPVIDKVVPEAGCKSLIPEILGIGTNSSGDKPLAIVLSSPIPVLKEEYTVILL